MQLSHPKTSTHVPGHPTFLFGSRAACEAKSLLRHDNIYLLLCEAIT